MAQNPIPQILQKLRDEGLSQAAGAVAVGISAASFCRILAGKQVPRKATRRAFRRRFGVPVHAWPAETRSLRAFDRHAPAPTAQAAE